VGVRAPYGVVFWFRGCSHLELRAFTHSRSSPHGVRHGVDLQVTGIRARQLSEGVR